jgi:hypothetical protein
VAAVRSRYSVTGSQEKSIGNKGQESQGNGPEDASPGHFTMTLRLIGSGWSRRDPFTRPLEPELADTVLAPTYIPFSSVCPVPESQTEPFFKREAD